MIRTTSGDFVVYFAAALKGTGSSKAGNDAKPAGGARCIGTATSTSPMGKFTANQQPPVCAPQDGQPATIRMVRLADANGTTVLGASHQLLRSGTGSFGDTVEAPSLVQHGGWFILFVAHGNYDSCGYSTQWFRSAHIWAWSNGAGSTLLDSASTGLCGPGSADVTGSRIAGPYQGQ